MDEARAAGALLGVSGEMGEEFWNHFESSGWIDRNGNRVVSWKAKLSAWKARNQARPLELAHNSNGSAGLSGIDKAILYKELERVQEQIRRLDESVARDASGSKLMTQAEKAKKAELRAKKCDIRKKLGLD